MKILILALSGIGDALMFSPSIRLLRESFPQAQIDALVMYKGVNDMFIRNSKLNNVFYFDFVKEGTVKSLKYLLKLRGKYYLTINVYPSNRKEYNLFNFLLGAKKRAGVSYLRKNNSNLGFLNNITVTENDNLHNVEENLRLCEKIINGSKTNNESFDLEFPLFKEDLEFAEAFLSEKNIRKDDLVIGFHPGCATLKNHEKRRWEPDKFSELGKKLVEKHNANILIFGGPEENALKEKVASSINSSRAIVVNKGNLAQSAAIMKRCNLFVTNDSSLMHIASALKLNVIAIIGPTNPSYIHPWRTDHEIVTLNLECAPCFYYSPKPLTCYRNDIQYKCIKELKVDMVYSAAERFLETTKES